MENMEIIAKRDVIFKDSKGKELKYHTYGELIEYLESKNIYKSSTNRLLLANKYCKVLKRSDSYLAFQEIEKNILNEIKNNNKLIKGSLNSTYDFISFEGEISDKLVIGMGNVSTFETDITLHHTYGIPYIPGSAIKGVLRNYIIENYSEKFCDSNCDEKREKKAESNDVFRSIFGGKNKKGKNIQGKVIFMDSFPKYKYEVKLDVMTPHHKGYYEKGMEPVDTEEPTPINFLVLKNCEFQFYIAVDKTIKNDEKLMEEVKKIYEEKNIEKFILENLIEALTFHGIGAKTSVGYGYFEIDKEAEIIKLISEQEKRKKEEELKLKKELEEAERIKEEEKFKNAIEGKSELEIDLYKFDQIKEKSEQYNRVIAFYNEKINKLGDSDKIVLAKYVKNCLESNKRWKYKPSKNGKQDKNSKKVEEICKILSVKLPIG